MSVIRFEDWACGYCEDFECSEETASPGLFWGTAFLERRHEVLVRRWAESYFLKCAPF